MVGMRLGSLVIWRNDKAFEEDDLVLVEMAATEVGIQLVKTFRMKILRKNS